MLNYGLLAFLHSVYTQWAVNEHEPWQVYGFKTKMIKEGVKGAEEWDSVKDIPRLKMFELIERMQKKKWVIYKNSR